MLALWAGTLSAEEPRTAADTETATPEATADAEKPAESEAPQGADEAVQGEPSRESEGAANGQAVTGAEQDAGATEGAATGSRADLSPIQIDLDSPIEDLEKAIGFSVDGSISGRYRFRASPGDDQDQDLFQNFYLQLGKPEVNSLSAVFLGRLSEDIDGHPSGGSFSVYDDVSNTYESNVNGRFYLGYFDLQRLEVLDRMQIAQVRAGRQIYEETADTLIFDGGRIDSRVFENLAGLRLTAYGGLPTHYYESSPSGDAVAGTGLELSPARRTRVRVDWTYLKDREKTFDSSDYLLSAALWQAWESGLSLHGRYNLLGDETRDYFVRGDYRNVEHDLFLEASFRQLVTTLREQPLEFDRYYQIMREYSPYWQVTARASKGLAEYFVVDAGMDLRQLIHEDDEGIYNHEFTRYYVTPATRDWPVRGMSIAGTVDLWDSEEDDFFTFGGEIRQKLLKALEVAAGTYYSLYKLDRFSEDEKERVQTYFGRINYNLARDVLISVLYEYEKDDFNSYNTVEASFTYTF